jgi:diphthamide biosynthesis methyltransferase
VDHNETRVVGRLMQPALAIGVCLLQVGDAALVATAPEDLVAEAEQRAVLDEQVECGASLRARRKDVDVGVRVRC